MKLITSSVIGASNAKTSHVLFGLRGHLLAVGVILEGAKCNLSSVKKRCSQIDVRVYLC